MRINMEKITFLLEKINQNKPLDFGTIFSNSIDLFKKVWVQGLITILINLAFIMPLYFLLYLPLVVMGAMNPESLEDMEDLSPIILIVMGLFLLIFMTVAIALAFGLKSAFYRICKNKDLGITATDDYLYFLKKPYLGKTITLAGISLGISILAATLCFFPVIYVMVPIMLMTVVYAFNPDLTVSEILKTSFALGNKKWLITFGLIIVAGFLSTIVGYIMCFIGVFVTASFAYIPHYYIYKETIGFEEKDAIDQIGTL